MLKHKKNIFILIVIYGLEGIAANLAHPVTPSLMKMLDMPGYMFGLALATMQFTNFLFSPFWGTLVSYIQPKLVLLLGCFGYAIGQLVFGFATNANNILIGRSLSGFFVSATTVSAVFYLVRLTEPDERKSTLPLLITAFTVMGTFGQFIGGYFGEMGVRLPFVIQATLLVMCGLLFYFCLTNIKLEENSSVADIVKKSNPIKTFIDVRKFLTPVFITQFIIVLLMGFATTTVTQTFGYYIIDVLKKGSSFNGNARAVVGVISIVLNMTLTIKITKSKHVERNLSVIYGIVAFSVVMMFSFPLSISIFIGFGIISMSFDTILPSVLQERTVSYASSKSQGIILGTHNSVRSLGGIMGALIAGYLYDINVIYPFLMAAILYVSSMVAISMIVKLNRSNKTSDYDMKSQEVMHL